MSEVAMSKYKLPEVTMLQDKSKFVADERDMSLYISSDKINLNPQC